MVFAARVRNEIPFAGGIGHAAGWLRMLEKIRAGAG